MRILNSCLARAAFFAMVAQPASAAPPTDAQKCESTFELASAKFAQCRLTAESKFTKAPDAAKLSAAVAKCSTKLSDALGKAVTKYGGASCTAEAPGGFDAYLTQCSNDVEAASEIGGSLPDYVGDLAACDGSLATCNGDLATAQSSLATCESDLTTCDGDLTTCEADLAVCQAAPPAQVLETGQTTSFGSGTDGDLQLGVARAYVDNGDGTITDTRTGLMWEKKSDDGTIHDKDNTYAWSATGSLADGPAFTTFLATLNAGGGFAGYTDWRLPNEFELLSLQNFGNLNPSVSAAFNTSCGGGCTVLTCSCTSASFGYWSSTSRAGNDAFAWVVGFSEGHVPRRRSDRRARTAVRAAPRRPRRGRAARPRMPLTTRTPAPRLGPVFPLSPSLALRTERIAMAAVGVKTR